ncbi:2-iminobutanoate/2-iminopropanoate deaminase [Caprobacter fermentans]|uniref:2-iminobutanoate/2-iminopropanoate deaminase n=1 Tax=Caproicibacter fermentans TaxID=2576756 RepID=A0A6N8HX56_9FIRM|nr:RidA family protein [Caproicibacter fermentans]MVB10185.1 2-iminobutanoate/2-iminopropanoate deaminase [Caproicibacter fermentans]OCN00830.1 hypothetical protein A7X67_08670 [Clostridium sp. W14A]QNK42537.1 RidA family protein [Caproicibacter fermentans]
MKKTDTKNAPAAIGPYSQAVEANGFLFTSGQIPLSPKTMQIVEGGIEAQTEQVIQNLREVLAESHISFEQTVKTTCYLANIDDFEKFNRIYEKYFTEKPARSCISVKALPENVLCEIDLVATLA